VTLAKFKIPGGVYTDNTDYSTGPFWTAADRVRFQQGQPEPIGGWEAEAALNATNGTPSKSLPWQDLSNNVLMAIGTEQFLYIIKNSTLFDITPVDNIASLSGAIDTVNTDNTVSVNDTSHDEKVGDWAVITGCAAVGGLTINGTVKVATVVNANKWTFEHASAATSTVSGGGGGSISITYLLETGNAVTTAGLGWGADVFGKNAAGDRAWGDAATSSAIQLDATLWSFDLFGEDLIACRRGGLLYRWDASVGTGTRATVIANSPSTNLFVAVSTPDRHLVSYGAHDGGASDPMNIAWANQDTTTTWTATATNTAGNRRPHPGDKMVAQCKVRDQMLVWSDKALFAQIFAGDPFTFAFRYLSSQCIPMGQNAIVCDESNAYWMGTDNFHIFDGAERILNSPVRDFVYGDLNNSFTDIIFGGLNPRFSEVWWFYPSAASLKFPDKYVTFNTITKEWSTGLMARTTWNPPESWRTVPYTFGSDGKFYNQETGLNADGSSLSWSLSSGVIEIPDAGDQLFFIDRWVPDIEQQTGDITLTLFYRKYPRATENSKTATLAPTTDKVTKRIRGRQLRIGYSSTAAQSFAKIGDLRADWMQDGER